jgi:hypothetical protein
MGAWAKWGALVGGLGWLLFHGIMGLIVRAGEAGATRDNRLEAIQYLFWLTPLAVIVAGAVVAGVAALIDFVRPIYLALFDTKRLEREYGHSLKQERTGKRSRDSI